MDEWINLKYRKQTPKLIEKPFPHLELKDFLKKNKLQELAEAVADQDFVRKDSDLFTFFQTQDLTKSGNKIIKEFIKFLESQEFRTFLQHITHLPLKKNIDLFASIYQATNYLLPHDDRLEGRKIAFNLYLTNLKKKDGGTLNLYANKNGEPTQVVKQLLPKANSFTLFLVSPTSYHEVEEVTSDTQRIALSGWYME
ncbi:2OG-Fe(II) oxygenase [Candidatus Woesearchaeota archaeon]|nr:2OG-Fe(II) oxygenase [Candidatus Woesearchaeota archaeon]